MLRVKVIERTMEADGIVGISFARANGEVLPEFRAGAHIDVHIGDGLSRQYSICSPPWELDRYRIGVLRDSNSRGGSKAMHDDVGVGDVLMVSEPKNHFPLAAEGGPSLLFAGGIGITPIICMAEELARAGRAFTLHYCGRSRDRMAFLDRLASAAFAHQVEVHCDDGPPIQRLDASSVISSASAEARLYVCGPTGFMDHVLGTARSLGRIEERLHREYFAPPVALHEPDGSFEVVLKLSGRVVQIPADRSVAEALAEAGVFIPMSCGQGVCGTCITRVLEGIPDHRDAYFTDDERCVIDSFTPCCSRSLTPRLVLDL